MKITWARRATALAVGLAVAAAGCGPTRGSASRGGLAGTQITFSISVSEEERPAIQALLTLFQQKTKARVNLEMLGRFRAQGGVRVNLVTSIGSSQLEERLEADARRGKPSVQLFAQDNLGLSPLVDRHLIEDLSDVAVPQPVGASMLPPRFGGRQYFLPFRPNVRLAYADRAHLADAGATAPTTVEELKATAEKLKATAGRPEVTLSLAEGDPAAVTISEWVVSFGGNPLILNDEGSKRAFQLLSDLWREGVLARESLFGRFDTEPNNLRTGASWLAQNWPITSAQLAKDGLLNRFDVYPGWHGPARAAHVVGGDVLGIPQGVTGRQRAAALALADFLMSKPAQEYLVDHNAWPSIRDDAYDRVPKEQQPTFDAIRQALQDGWFRPSVPYWPDVTSAISRAVDRVLLQSQPVDTVLDDEHLRIESAARTSGATYPP